MLSTRHDRHGQGMPRDDSTVFPSPVIRNTAEERKIGAKVSTGKSPMTLDQNQAEMEYMPQQALFAKARCLFAKQEGGKGQSRQTENETERQTEILTLAWLEACRADTDRA